MIIDRIAAHLTAPRDFVEVATAVCSISREVFGLLQCVVSLHDESGRPLLAVDNLPQIPDEHRMQWFDDVWERDPLYQVMREHHAPVGDEAGAFMALARAEGYTGEHIYTLLLPILYPAGLLGAIRLGSDTPITPTLRRDLTTLGTMVSVRLTQLSVAPTANSATSRLTARQLDVARIAGGGATNAEIATKLGLSENTVKKHLKDIFEELGVSNRTGLASMISQAGPAHAYPKGITRLGELTITNMLSRTLPSDETTDKS